VIVVSEMCFFTISSVFQCSVKTLDENRITMSWRLIIIPLLFVNLLYGCTGHYAKTVKTKGVYHRVKTGETLWSIAKAYNINIQELAEINNITDPKLLGQDRVLFIPEADQVIDDVMSSVSETETPGKTIEKDEKTPAARTGKEEPPFVKAHEKPEVLSPRAIPQGKEKSKSTIAKSEEGGSAVTAKTSPKQESGQKVEQKSKEKDNGGESERIKFDKERFVWPMKGKVRSKFGVQPNGMYYNGITIGAREGTPVLAAASGTIIRSASFKCCGETIIIKHEDEYATVYYNLGSRVLKEGDQVKKGSHIAFLGKPEKKGESYLNFEIRYKNKARNPLFFLP
jgi:murein DD-endopeptidase MepM/ murein hydrolase activator NlpD